MLALKAISEAWSRVYAGAAIIGIVVVIINVVIINVDINVVS